MRSSHGFSLMELVVIMGVVGILAAVAIPSMTAAVERNRIVTGAELVAAQIREARLAAVTGSAPVRVRFDCPAPGAIRMLTVTGEAAIDDADDRCTNRQAGDGPAIYLPSGVSFGDETPPTVQIDGRGEISTVGGGGMPLRVLVTHGDSTRALIITAAGRVAIPSY